MMLPDTLVDPVPFCHRHPKHRIEEIGKTAGPGKIVFCWTCSEAYCNVLSASGGDAAMARRFVEDIRENLS